MPVDGPTDSSIAATAAAAAAASTAARQSTRHFQNSSSLARRRGIIGPYSRGMLPVSPDNLGVSDDGVGTDPGTPLPATITPTSDVGLDPLQQRRRWNLYSPTDEISEFLPEQVIRLSGTLAELYAELENGGANNDRWDESGSDDDDDESSDSDGSEFRAGGRVMGRLELQFLLNALDHGPTLIGPDCETDSDLMTFLNRLRDENVIDADYFRQIAFREKLPFEITSLWLDTHPGYDCQGIPWSISLQDIAKHKQVRQVRRQMYQGYHDLNSGTPNESETDLAACSGTITTTSADADAPTTSYSSSTQAASSSSSSSSPNTNFSASSSLRSTSSTFVERPIYEFSAGYPSLRPYLLHFQLRNLIAPVTRNEVYVSEKIGGSFDIKALNPTCRTLTHAITPEQVPLTMRNADVSTISATKSFLVVGGFRGEYLIKHLASDNDLPIMTGRLTNDWNGITNHVGLFQDSTQFSERAVFASNDRYLRDLDIRSGQFVSEDSLPWAVNCSAYNPQQPEIRVLVGDATFALLHDNRIVGKSKTIGSLTGHSDYGFACAWSSDGHTIATGNQDGTCRIYDSRNYSKVIHVHRTTMNGAVRAMSFDSSGNHIALAEPIDYVTVLDASSGFTNGQVIEMWGEIGGLGFVDGENRNSESLLIGNCDRTCGGVYLFNKTDYGSYSQVENVYL